MEVPGVVDMGSVGISGPQNSVAMLVRRLRWRLTTRGAEVLAKEVSWSGEVACRSSSAERLFLPFPWGGSTSMKSAIAIVRV